ncbi:diamine N-acetyltransferase [Natranaerovirga pectinivora]|uniref:Diamine N-acetyltransferase n=1 Tax=Natranaerovirga pectinivora TaxID=682400 RepID=A0A4R3MPG9_9FIRM|nr:GNAT family N-acetyltransferase [Natranaerovirga pectinivora]TCT17197.1 diamine N-acetyltransferase [Natranaerovirga pectinivora]
MIKGQQIILKPSKLSDKRKIYEWLCLSETARSHMGPPNFEDTPIPSWEEYCEDFEDYYFDGSKPECGQLWIISYENEEIGAICYSSFHLKGKSAELDIWMSTEKHCGKGFGSESIKVFCDYLIQILGIERFIIRPSKRNTRAVRAYEKGGFVKVLDEDKQKVVKEFLLDEYLDVYGQGDYGIGDDVVLIM